jgi:hypothetical protein
MNHSDDLDSDRVKALAKVMMEAVLDNYQRGPASRDRVFEALNALAVCAALVVAGAGDRGRRWDMRAFLDKALDQNITDLVRDPPGG